MPEPMLRSVTIALDLTVEEGVDLNVLADQIVDYLCDAGDGIVDYPALIFSVDGAEPRRF